MGPSGSGKSTLLNLIGLLDRPTAGSVTIDGQDTGTLDDDGLTRYRGRAIGFVFQFHHLLPEFTALENVMLPMMADRGRPEPGDGRVRAATCSARWGSATHLHKTVDAPLRRPGAAGRDRARARDGAAARPRRRADREPGHPQRRRASSRCCATSTGTRGVTFLVVTHDPRLAARCDRIVEVVDGRIVGDRANAEGADRERRRNRRRPRSAPPRGAPWRSPPRRCSPSATRSSSSRAARAASTGTRPRAASGSSTGRRACVVTATERRSQSQNRGAALERLRERLAAMGHEPKPRRPTKPTRGSKLRRLDEKKRRSEMKEGRRGGEE